MIKEANERRQSVKESRAAKKREREAEKESLAMGIVPESLKNWSPVKEVDKGSGFGENKAIIPLLPFGQKEYDEGERFDLRNPINEGWIDPEEMGETLLHASLPCQLGLILSHPTQICGVG